MIGDVSFLGWAWGLGWGSTSEKRPFAADGHPINRLIGSQQINVESEPCIAQSVRGWISTNELLEQPG